MKKPNLNLLLRMKMVATVIRRKRRMRHLHAYMRRKGCSVCGFNDIRALQWDHIEPVLRNKKNTKDQGITAQACRNLKVWMAEIRKCRLVCANCHSIHTKEAGQCTRASEYWKNRKAESNET